jgi:hypothetical protein
MPSIHIGTIGYIESSISRTFPRFSPPPHSGAIFSIQGGLGFPFPYIGNGIPFHSQYLAIFIDKHIDYAYNAYIAI